MWKNWDPKLTDRLMKYWENIKHSRFNCPTSQISLAIPTHWEKNPTSPAFELKKKANLRFSKTPTFVGRTTQGMQGFNPNVPYVSHGDGKQLKFSQGFALWVSQGKAKQPKGGSKLSRIDIFMSDPAAPMATKVDLNLSPKIEESVRYCWWKKSCTGWYDYLQGFIHVRWCRTSSINSTKRTWVDQFTTLAGIWMQMFHLGSFESSGPQIGNLSGSILIHFPVDQHHSTEKLKIPLPCSSLAAENQTTPTCHCIRGKSPSRTTGSSIILGLPQQTKRQISNLWPKLGEAWLPYNTIYVCAIMQRHTISILLNMFVLSMCVYDVLLQNANHAASLIIRYDKIW